jgi:NAD+ synthase (glutamine-hydrolysing)
MDLLDHNAFLIENQVSLEWLKENLPGEIAAAVGHVDENPSKSGKSLINVVSVLKDSQVIHQQAKTLLPTYDVFDEARYFQQATEWESFSLGNEQVGIAICEDLWWETEPSKGTRYPIDPVGNLLSRGTTVIISPSASPYFHGKGKIRADILKRVGETGGVPVVYVNATGANDNLIFDGMSLASNGKGDLIHVGSRFKEEFTLIDLEEENSVVELHEEKERDLLEALVLGVKDYLHKCGFNRVHLGLSGGIDSALVAVIAARAIGPENVRGFALPSGYSSEASYSDAKELAENLGISFDKMPIDDLFQGYLSVLEPHFTGKEPDVTEENIQARIRGNLLMAYSNKWGSLLLTTGNKSELATGYCTLYGDMCGGLSVIGDLLKTEVFALCRYINRDEVVIPLNTIAKPPSAELRHDQKDEDSLPPYEVLDRILVLYLIENLGKEEIVERGFDPELVSWILKLVGRSEFKRIQAAPVLKVSPRAFGTGRRMPIARSIYEA